MTQTERKKRRRRSSFRRFVKFTIAIFLLLLIITGGVAAYATYKINSVTSDSQQELARGELSEFREINVAPADDNISILFLGVDDRDESLNGRTDAMILATFNKDEGSINLLSIPRDSRVDIPDRGMDKINHAHAFGGVDLTVSTVENLLEIPVDYYVKLNFDAFIEIIDTLNGVTVDVPFTFSEMDSNDRKGAVTLQEGEQTLTGEEALAYVRMRRLDSDLERGKRQADVIKALIDKGTSFSSITRFNSILDVVENHLSTNLSFKDIVSLHTYSSSLNDIETHQLQGSDARIDGVYYYELQQESLSDLSEKLQNHLDLNTNN